MIKKSLLLLSLLFFVSSGLLAQQEITGKVTDENNDPIVGANVLIKGTNDGTITDLDGVFKISAPKDATLLISFIGYTTQEIAIAGNTNLEVTLLPDETALEDIVVTAMGVERDRKTLGYAITKVKGEELTMAGTSNNPVQALYGKAPGVTIRQSASGPTGGIDINIRGNSGLMVESNTRPLIVVDGAPIFDENTGMRDPANEWSRPTDYGTGINDINPDDIASIEILKGAQASVLYGSEGANGVVLITTKNGAGTNKLKVEASFQSTIEQPVSFLEFQQLYGAGSSIYDIKTIEAGQTYPFANYSQQSYGPAFDANDQRVWWDSIARPYVARPGGYEALLQNGHSNQVNISVINGGEFGNIRFSYTNNRYVGVQNNYQQDKNTFSFMGNFKMSDRFKLNLTTNLYNVKTQNRMREMHGTILDGFQQDAPYEEYINNNGYLYQEAGHPNYNYRLDFGDSDYNYPTSRNSLGAISDYLWERERNSDEDKKNHVIASISPEYKISNAFSIKGQASIDYTNTDFTTEHDNIRVYPELLGGKYKYERRNTIVQNYQAMLDFKKSLINDRLYVFSFVGGSYKKVKENSVYVSTYADNSSTSSFIFPNWFHLNNQHPEQWTTSNRMNEVRGNSFGQNSLYGLFGLASFTWDDVYTLEITARNDWSSLLPPGNNSYFYPGAAFTWNFTELLSESLLPILQFGKLRASFADVGKDAPSRYYAYQSYQAGVVTGTSASKIEAPSVLFSGDLLPERKREFELGLEMNFFNGRVGIDFSYYTNRNYNKIMGVPLDATTGAGEIRLNAGEIKNDGFEAMLNFVPIKTPDFRWDVSITAARQYSEVVKLYSGIKQRTVATLRGGVYVMAVEGERTGNIYGHSVMRDEQGNQIVNSSGTDYVLDNSERTIVGNVNPDFLGGFTTSLSYKGFTLHALFDYSFGASMFSETNQWMMHNGTHMETLNYRDEAHGGLAYYYDGSGNTVAWQHDQPTPGGEDLYHDGIVLDGVVDNGDGTYTDNTRIVPVRSYYEGFASWASADKVNAEEVKYDNDYIKLRELSLSYRFPKNLTDKMKLGSIRLNVFARNIGYLYKTIPNLDPEAYVGTNSFFEAAALPSTRSFGAKLIVGF